MESVIVDNPLLYLSTNTPVSKDTEPVQITIKKKASEKGNNVLILNTHVVDLMVQKNTENPGSYPLSKVIDIVHRSIPNEDLNTYQAGDISYVRKNHDKTPSRALISGDTVVNFQGQEIVYKDIILPGSQFEKQILDLLDDKYTRLDWKNMTETEVCEASALFAIAVAAGHIKPDGNLRSSVGLAKFLIDSKTSTTLSVEELDKRKIELKDLFDQGIAWLLPEKFTPSYLINNNKGDGPIKIDVKRTLDTQDNSFLSTLENGVYRGEVAHNIDTNINFYEPNPEKFYEDTGSLLGLDKQSKMPNPNLQKVCEKLAILFKECSSLTPHPPEV